MPIQQAVEAYTIERLNCAQSVLRAFQRQTNITEEMVQAAKDFGHGKAEGGRCGALHAALELAGDETVRGRIREAFLAKAQAESCREIRKAKSIRCVQCVELAAALLAEHRRGVETHLGDEKGP